MQARQRYEEDQGVLRALRMALRDITCKLLSDKRWRWFHEPGGLRISCQMLDLLCIQLTPDPYLTPGSVSPKEDMLLALCMCTRS